MDFLAENLDKIVLIVTNICGAIISATLFLKSISSEKRVKKELAAIIDAVGTELANANQNVKITREGIVQAFKDTVVTKDIKVSINTQVKKILDERLDKFVKVMIDKEDRRTQMMYYILKILDWTAASGKLTVEQRGEIDELLAMIGEDERIVDTEV